MYLDDPVVDWLSHPAMDKTEVQDLRDTLTWEPRRRVDACARKLRGVSPADLLLDDLQQNAYVQKLKSYTALERIVLGAVAGVGSGSGSGIGVESGATRGKKQGEGQGSGRSHGRSREHGDGGDGGEAVLEVRDQIDAILAIATSPDVLARQWRGLAAWI